jgi:predicted secreted protein
MIQPHPRLRLATAALLCGILAACGTTAPTEPPPEPRLLTLGMPQSGGRFVLLQGEELRIRLPADHAAGYRWSMVNQAPGGDALDLAEEPAYESGNTEVWHFRAGGTGPTILYFVYRRDGGPAAREAIYSFEIR